VSPSRAPGLADFLNVAQRPPISCAVGSGARMRSLIGGLEVVSGYGSVSLGSGQFNVPQQLLNGAQVGAPLEKMRGEGVAQGVREGAPQGASDPAHAARGEGTPASTEPEGLARGGQGEVRATPFEVLAEGDTGLAGR